MVEKLPRVVACPKCRKSARYDATNEYRPFCSARCKNEDIVAWAQEEYRVPLKPSDDEEESASSADSGEKRED